MGIEDRLLKLKKRTEKAKTEKDRAEGRKAELTKRLKNDFKCSSLANAHKKLLEMKRQIASLNKEIEKGVIEIEENYEI